MSKLERITVTMPEEMAAQLRQAVDSGQYATTSEVVRDALREWTDHQERRQIALAQLRALIAEGEKGPFVDGPAFMESLKVRVSKGEA
jgi:antitoxin ParD1/3/4